MCGITGILNLDRTRPDQNIINSMTKSLFHRGPDDKGFVSNLNYALGFTRLSIIDLTSLGNQPLFNENKKIISICNGEIYNYKELKNLLISKGHKFYTNTDVEVLPHLYEEYGYNFLNKLNGQFSFAIFDENTRKLFLARDHVGIAPLFYTIAGNQFIFGSEIKAILQHPFVKREVDLTGLDQMFSFPGNVSPRTMFKNIKALKPGNYLVIDENTNKLEYIKNHEYWDLNYPLQAENAPSKPLSWYIEQMDDILMKAVKYRLQADVPVGFYLSGGLDSSIIASLIHKISSQQRHSFSIGFKQAEIDERKYQHLMAQKVNSIHHEAVFDSNEVINRIKKTIYHAESPLKESYDTCSLTLSESVRNNNIKVVLTGEGADELFAGYIGYRFDMERGSIEEDPFDVQMQMEKEIREKLWGDLDFLYERNHYEFDEIKLGIYSKNLSNKFNEFHCIEKELINKDKIKGRHPLHKRSYLDFKLRLSDHLLADHGDRVAYANSIEARYPFLDIDFIEFVKTIPPQMKLNKSIEKYILKEYAKKYLPDEIIKREKFAFVAPGSPYLIKQNIEWLNDLLSYNTIKKQGYFNPDTIERLKKLYLSDNFNISQTFENDLLMIIITFGIFLEIFDIPNYSG